MVCTKYFEICGETIYSTIMSIVRDRGIDQDELYAELIKHLANNSSEWYQDRQPRIPYSDPLCRLAYLYGTVPVNANFIEQALSEDIELREYIDRIHENKGRIEICAFGGGPGTELLGMAKWLESRNLSHTIDLDFLLLDRVNEWADSWFALRKEIDARFAKQYGKARSGWPLTCSGSFLKVDITDTSNFANLGNLFGQDLYILCYALSEIHENQQDLRDFASTMARQAPTGSKFLFIDRHEVKDGNVIWLQQIVELAHQAGIKLAEYYHPKKGTMDSMDEPSSDLGQIYSDVKDYHRRNDTSHTGEPRRRWDAFWVVGTKVDEFDDEGDVPF